MLLETTGGQTVELGTRNYPTLVHFQVQDIVRLREKVIVDVQGSCRFVDHE